MMKYRSFSLTAIAVALVAANAVSYAAENGRRWTHLGEVSSVNDNQIVMTQAQGQEKSFTLTADAKLTLDGRTIQATELKPGTKIRVTTTKNDQNAISRIEAIDKRSNFADSFRDGKLVSITDNQLVMKNARGREHSHTLAADAELILDGKPCEASDLKPGMKIRATTEGADQSVANRVEAYDKTERVANTANAERNGRDGKADRGTDNQLVQPRTNVRMEAEGTNQNETDRRDATNQRSDAATTQREGNIFGGTDQKSDAARTQLDGNIFGRTDNQLVQPRKNAPMETEGTSQKLADRSDATDQKSDAAGSQREGNIFGGTDNQLVQPRKNASMETEGTNQKLADRSDATDQKSKAGKNQRDGKVVSINDDRLVMTCAHCNAKSTCTLAKDVRFTCDGRPCKSEDLKPGMRIRVKTDREAPNKTTQIDALDKDAEFASL